MPINFLLFYYMNLISLNSSEGEGVADPPPPPFKDSRTS